MNRRNFFKTVTGFVAGVCAAFVPKAKPDIIIFPTEEKAREFARKRIKPSLSGDSSSPSSSSTTSTETPWDKLGCKDCFRECGQWDICMATLKKQIEEIERKNHPAYIIDKNGFVSLLVD